MRRVLALFSLLVTAAIVGCGGSAAFKNSSSTSANPSLSTASSSASGNSSISGGNTPASGTTTTGSSSTPTQPSSSGNPPSSPAPSSASEVAIASPADGATVGSPTQVSTSVSGSAVINTTQLYVDSGLSFQAASPQVNTALQLPQGAHTLIAQVWDQNGNSYTSAPVHIMVQAAAPAPPAPPPPAPPAPAPPAPSAAEIQTQAGWASCDACAGAGGNGPATAHGMQQGIGSPSLSGSAARFDVGGTSWGAALFWKELGSHDEAQNLKYDLDFYVDDSVANGQALEFDVNQTAGGGKYIFGTECDFRGSGTFRVWNGPAATWVSTGISCPQPQANTWHHLTWELQRSGGQAKFVAVTLDGNRQPVGMSFNPVSQSGSGLDVAFQADLMASGANVSVWLDNVSLSW